MKPGGGPAGTKKTRLFVDAIEAGRARLLAGEEAFTVPAALLPPGAVEGSWLELAFRLVPPAPGDPDPEADALRRKLSRDDPGGPIKL
jgi:hypothetical protein